MYYHIASGFTCPLAYHVLFVPHGDSFFLPAFSVWLSRLYFLPGCWPGSSLLANEGNIYSECTKGLFQSRFQWRMLKGLQWHFEQLPMFLLFSMRVWIQFSVKTNTTILLGILKTKCKTLMIQMIRKKDLCLSEKKNDNQLWWIWSLLITNKNDCKDIIPLLFHILSYNNLNIM